MAASASIFSEYSPSLAFETLNQEKKGMNKHGVLMMRKYTQTAKGNLLCSTHYSGNWISYKVADGKEGIWLDVLIIKMQAIKWKKIMEIIVEPSYKISSAK